MDYERTGRKLGIGVKVLGRMASQRLVVDNPTAPPKSPAGQPAPPASSRPAPPVTPARLKVASRRFGESVWGPFSRAGHMLWLEVTGLFFALFALGFGAQAWKLRDQWQTGPEHRHFLAYAAFTVIFAWFCGSSFLRARRRGTR